jgi:two-component system, chemotaxis family, CheB/CheR fusion protein
VTQNRQAEKARRPKKSGAVVHAANYARRPRFSSQSAARPLIVGIGASAGGLNAFKTFFENMPVDSGMAFVLVQHLAPTHKSILADLLGKVTVMPVIEAEDGTPAEANRVYVIPPDATLTFEDRTLRVTRPAPPRGRRRPIDTFFSSLAEDQGENAVCIVLSGTGSDGTLGLKAIKEHGGLALAQAEFDHMAVSGMPHSAVATGVVDDVMRVEDMPARLVNYQSHLRAIAPQVGGDDTRRASLEHLAKITAIVRARSGHDFSKYKEKILLRRLQRRMQVLQIDTVPAYIDRLRRESQQVELLFREFLIGVTKFFHDPNAFAALQATAIPKLLKHKGPNDQVRIWVPGCATGEEVYSIAILVKEAMERRRDAPKVQIFGTDIDPDAVSIARHGCYRKTAGLSSERLRRWFVEEGGEYCPVREVREMCVFSIHSVVKDPPFSKLDLISCRNLLIYMDADLQDRVLQIFQYALNPSGTLFLGPSEGVARFTNLFGVLDKKHRIYQRRNFDVTRPELPPFAALPPPALTRTPAIPRGEDRIDRSTRRALEKYSPAYVVVDNQNQILRFSGGEVGRYLEPSSGAASLNLFGILRKALRSVVRAALHSARATNQPVVHRDLSIRVEGKSWFVTVIVEPIGAGGAESGLCVLAFQDAGAGGERAKVQTDASNVTVAALKQELHTTRTQLQATIDELETTNEESKSAAEEYQSVNEEIQSSNEELETAKEELQSVNEELQTINAEMISKNATLIRLNSDLKNLLDSTEIATIFLDDDLCIKAFTPGMTDIFPLRDTDCGRAITEIVTQLSYPDLQNPDLSNDVKAVLRTLSVVEREVQLADKGMTFIMRIRPYRTVDNVIDGVVITFIDISERKRGDAALRASEERFSAIVKQATVGVAETDLDGCFILVNERYCELVGYSAVELRRLRMQDIVHPEDWPRDAEAFARLSEGEPFQIEKRYVRPDGTTVWVHCSVSALRDQQGRPRSVLTINLDIAGRKQAEEDATLLLGELDHRVKNILAIVSAVIAQTLKASATPGAFAAAMEGRIAAIARAHSLVIQRGVQREASLRKLITTELAPYNRRGYNIAIDGEDVALTPRAGFALSLAIHELASNAAKYGSLSTPAGRLTVAWVDTGEMANRKLDLIWMEADGPVVKPPVRQGFGTKLLERGLVHELDATVNAEFRESGLRYTIEIPLTAEVSHMRVSDRDEGNAR